MFAALLVVHIIVCLLLVGVVLLQGGRGAELGAAFGSVGQATFARGSTTFMSKFTTSLAVIFMVTSLSLAFLTSEEPGQSVLSGQMGAPAGAVDAPGAPGTVDSAEADAQLQEPPAPIRQEEAQAPAAPQGLEQEEAPAQQ